ncbi:KilA-N domain-containing protein [Cyanobium sp. BA5m-10]|uniref:KilA-N domain-containing protein n=1 Tax=Cyanobium sp. BA5m-10 TaxID=2823705 RepID=UPI0020CDF496|nr:KilA-N domain-containing protein [Cyanobium sp. BA5m-10]MCP9905021.1 KilA-N domain-containing protein [Cyanobium sp. BA5m-10]
MNHPALVSRSWKGTPISRRTSDGYVNATAMCKANNKQWSKYRESDRCQTYLDALAETSVIRMFDLIESRQGQGGGTWVHPQVAVDLARWISAPFAVWMDGWFLESVQQAQRAPAETSPPRLREVDVIALVERSIGLFERLGGLDQRDQLLFKDIVRSNILTASSGGSTRHSCRRRADPQRCLAGSVPGGAAARQVPLCRDAGGRGLPDRLRPGAAASPAGLGDNGRGLHCPGDEPRNPPPAAVARGAHPGQALPPLGLHPGSGAAAVAPRKRGGEHHWLEPAASAALKTTNRT